ncbi:substrate-binding domain-containing protein [Propylenella binzhouense]|uniref:substrate-binding domain-containing protein n=1 Tax=Propylenella binzhouense TaxID=2555902 RepID=UPI00136CBA4F
MPINSHVDRRKLLKLGAAAAGGVLATPFISKFASAQGGLAGKTIGFSQSYVTTNWIKAQREGVIQTAKKYGLETIVTDANHQPTKQITDLEDLVTRRVDAIILSTYYSEAISPAVRHVNEAGIPLIVLSSALQPGVDYTVHLGTDTLATAKDAGDYYVKKLNGKGKVIQILGSPGSTVNQHRGEGWHSVIDKVPEIEVIGQVQADYDRAKALRGMEDMLQAHGHIDAVYTHSEDMAMGALQAVKEAGRLDEMFITGYDGVSPEILQDIMEGEIEGVWYYAPFGTEGVDAAAAVLRGEAVKKDYKFPSPFISKANVLDYYDPDTGKAKVASSRFQPGG